MTAGRLLVVDDEADFGASVRRVAKGLGFEVEATTNGRDFKQAYERFDIDSEPDVGSPGA